MQNFDDSSGKPPKPIKNDITGLFELPSEPVVEFTADDVGVVPAVIPAEEPAITPPPFQVQEPVSIQEPIAPVLQDSLTPESPPHPSESLKRYSEQVLPGKPAVEAAYPFSLKITGKLKATDQEKLLDLVSREQMGFREIDLEPQLQAGKMLLPRISEYAAVLIVQALRDSGARFELGPSDAIYSTEDTRAAADDAVIDAGESEMRFSSAYSPGFEELSEIPITAGGDVPGISVFEIVDTFSASLALEIKVIEAERSPQYAEAIQALQEELRARAKARGAKALIYFQVTLVPLSLPSRYRLMAIATAIRPLSEEHHIPTPPAGSS